MSLGHPWWLDWFSCWRVTSNIRCGITRPNDEIWDCCMWSKTTQSPTPQKNTVRYQTRCWQRCREQAELRPLSTPPQWAYRRCATNESLKDSLAFFSPAWIKPEGTAPPSAADSKCPSAWVTHQTPPASSSSWGSDFKIEFFSWDFIIRHLYHPQSLSTKRNLKI